MTLLSCWGRKFRLDENSVIKQYCEEKKPVEAFMSVVSDYVSETTARPIPPECQKHDVTDKEPCHFLFYNTGMSDLTIGIILLILSLLVLVGSLIIIVKLLNSLLKG